jgi:hypothetical protein
VSCHCQRQPKSRCKPNTSEREDWKRDTKQPKSIHGNIAEQRITSLKNPKHLEIDEPQDPGTRRVFKRSRGDLSAERRDKERQGSQKLQFEKSRHGREALRSKRLTSLKVPGGARADGGLLSRRPQVARSKKIWLINQG